MVIESSSKIAGLSSIINVLNSGAFISMAKTMQFLTFFIIIKIEYKTNYLK